MMSAWTGEPVVMAISLARQGLHGGLLAQFRARATGAASGRCVGTIPPLVPGNQTQSARWITGCPYAPRIGTISVCTGWPKTWASRSER
jgi:hypothetical protein